MEILLSKAKPSTQLNRRFEVSTCRHESPPTSIAPTSKLIKTEPNRPLHLTEDGGGGVDPIPCVSTHRISDPRSGPAQLLPHTSSSAATPTGSVHKSQTVSVVGMSGQLKRCKESWFGSLQIEQFAAGWLARSILCR